MESTLEAALDDGETKDLALQPRPMPPYPHLRARQSTALPAGAPVRKLRLRLTGDMERYLWSIDGKTIFEEPSIPIRRGEVLRIDLINDTMMHHPMHLHGHFFRLLNGQGDRAPLKHTVDVPPMATRTIEFLANEEGDWIFHCHLLYHMDSGMARVFTYDDQGPDHIPNPGALSNPQTFFMAHGMLGNHMTMGTARLMRLRDDLAFAWMVGLGDHEDYELDLAWERYLDPNRSLFAGYRWADGGEPGDGDRAIAGFQYRFPLLIDSRWSIDSEGGRARTAGKIPSPHRPPPRARGD